MMLALVLASLVAVLLRAPSPLEPVADAIMDRTPVAIAIPLLLRLGPLAQPLALCGAAALALAAGGLLGLLFPSHSAPLRGKTRTDTETSPATGDPSAPVVGERIGRADSVAAGPGRSAAQLDGKGASRLILTAAILVILVALVAPSGNPIVAAVLTGAYLLAMYRLSSFALRPSPNGEGRRQFLRHNARIVAGFAALIALLYLQPIAQRLRATAAGRPIFPWRPPRPRKTGFDLPGLTPEVTPVGQFYQMDEDVQRPALTLDGWSLSVEGLVRRPLRLTFADLLAMPRRDQWVTQRCVSNFVDGAWMSTALFSGVPVADLLQRAGLAPGATAALFRAPDGHEEAIPLALARDGDVMLAYAMDGRLLEQAHGFPARALIPGYYGFKSVKWVTTLRLTDNPRQGFWEREGWDPLPRVNTVARIDVARWERGGLLAAGVAFAGRRGVRAVQARVDDGPWRAAVLHTPALSPLTWAQWRITIPPRDLPREGQFKLQARAIDGQGVVQTSAQHYQYPSGATGYHTIVVTSH